MTRFMDKSFSTYAPGDDKYRDNWERIFAPKAKKPEPPKEPEPEWEETTESGRLVKLECGCDYTGCICYTRR